MTLQLRDKNMLCVEPNLNYFSILSRILLPDVDSKQKNNLRLDRAITYHDAIKKVSSKVEDILDNTAEIGKKKVGKEYDIIFCEYELGNGKTAQDLLEKMRKERIIPLGTIFIMIASERVRERVMAVLEFAPDAYIIKGNTPDDMEKRIVRAVRDRAELLHIYTAIHDKEYEKALVSCDTYIQEKKRLSAHVMKLRWFILLELHDYEWAKKAYKQIIEVEKNEAILDNRVAKPAAYAQNGLAKSLYYLWEKEEAEKILTTLVKDNPDFMAGYDLLSEVYLGTDRPEESQKVLEQATAKSPHRFDRQKLLGLTALDNDDLEGAKAAFKKLTTDGKSSNAQHPENFVHLAGIHTKEGDMQAADACLRRVKSEFKDSEFKDAAKFCAATMEHAIHTKKGDVVKARIALEEAVSLHKNGVDIGEMSERMQVNFACGCIEGWHGEVGAWVLGNALQNSPRKELVAKRAEKMLWDNPEAIKTIKAIEKKTRESIDGELENIMGMFKLWKHDLSRKMIVALIKEAPNNPDLLAKAAYIHFGCIDLNNPDVGMFNDAKKYLGNLIRLKSNHPDRESLTKQGSILDGAIRLVNMRSLAKKNGSDPEMLAAAIRAFFLYLNTQQFNGKLLMEASGFLQKLIQINPKHKDIFVLQSQEERIRKKHDLWPGNVPDTQKPAVLPKNRTVSASEPLPPIDDDLEDFIL